ncbi:hypothetical protein GCM10023208_30820 [Erythrobacter westpacificensis]|uniref:Uncharacterized protein n=1 Tax=Erythrobacter westpacificensis TaxID=1055231 RepID=A0ABP9KLJ5_9SPHN
MQRLQLDFQAGSDGARQSFDVPDIATALVVADINLADGKASIRDGEKLVARLEKRHVGGSSYWRVG